MSMTRSFPWLLTLEQPCMLSRVAARHLPLGAWRRRIVLRKAGLDPALAFGMSTPDAGKSKSSDTPENTLNIRAIMLFLLVIQHLKYQIIARFPRASEGSFGNGTQRQNESQGRRKSHALGSLSDVHESFEHCPTHSQPQSLVSRCRCPNRISAWPNLKSACSRCTFTTR
jgi:hypothetical protein